MLIHSGDLRSLKGKPWAAIEIVSELRIEEVVLHLSRWARKFLPDAPFQLLFPVQSRDLAGVRMLSPYLWARTADLTALEGVRSVMGVQGLVSDGAGRTIPIEDSFVQGTVKDAQAAAEGWSAGVRKGSFVRVLYGEQRMLCGRVANISSNIAEIVIALRLRNVRLFVPVRALLNLGAVPKAEREYYYTGVGNE